MDRRIDLTENLDFRKPIHIPLTRALLRTNRHIRDGAYFHELSSDDDIHENDDRPHLFPTGTAEDIRNIKYLEKIYCGDYCDCCGKRLLPWDCGLCSSCEKELEKSCKERIPWKTDESSLITTDEFLQDIEHHRKDD